MKAVFRWLRRIFAFIAALVVVLLAWGAIHEQIARSQAIRDYPPPGKMVDIGGRRMQINCTGHGSPTVVFESGAGPLGGLDWGKVQPSVAAFTRACSYSRAGELWSDPAGAPLTAKRVAQDLHATLAAAGEKPPYVLVGHSLGGPYVMTYTGIYPDEVAGLVLVDPAFPDQAERFQAIGNLDQSSPLPTLHVANALAWTGLTRLLFAGKAADPNLPPGAGATALAWLFRTLPTLVEEYAQSDAIEKESGQYRKLGNRPLIVLSSGNGFLPHAAELGLTPDQARRADQAEFQMHQEEASWSSNGQHRVIPGTDHFIQLEKPEAVIAAIKQVAANTKH